MLGLGVVAARRRRGLGAAAGILVMGLASGLMSAAHAQDAVSDEPGLVDREAYNGTFAFRYGPINFDNADVKAVLGDSGNQVMWIEFGPRLFPDRLQQLDLTFGIGRLREPGR